MRFGIEIHQTHDAAGRPDPRVFVHDLPERSYSDAALEDVYRLFRELEPTRTERPGEFWYRDAARGRGTLRVLGLAPDELDRVNERVQVHELERAIGMRDPMLWDRRDLGSRRVWRNPWISTAIGAAVALVGVGEVALALSTVGNGLGTALLAAGFGVIIGGLGVMLLVQHVRRIGWWTRARAAVRAAGLPMPTDLDPFE